MKKLAKIFTMGLLWAGLSTQGAYAGVSDLLAEENFSATLTMTTSYMYRGTSFSGDDPALQGSIDWAYGNFFAGIWSTSLSDQDGSGYELESDFYVGYANSFYGIDWYIMPIYYHFFGFDSENIADEDAGIAGAEADVFEVWLDASKAINDIFSLHAMYAYSPDFFYESGTAHYIKGDITANLAYGLSLNLGVGYQNVDGGSDYIPVGYSYSHWEIGLSKSWIGFDFDLRYHDTSDDSLEDDAVTNFYEDNHLTDDIVVFTVSRTF